MRSLVFIAAIALAAPAAAQSFTPAGTLAPGSGRGRVDTRVWAPGMRFPIRDLPAYANSQVYGVGGSHGPAGGGQCDSRNYSFPWWDNYCESRSWAMPLCPSGTGHQGQDIRPSTCRAGVHPAVAAAAGTITNIGRFSVYLTGSDGTRYDYLHLSNVRVRVGQRVNCGDVIGNVSNTFNGTPTTIHLHFNIRQAVRGVGSVYVPPYSSLIDAYRRVQGGSACTPSAPMMDAGVASDAGGAVGGPRGCYSATLRRPVTDGECVQVTAAGCGSDSCAWYACEDGAWQCTDASSCGGMRHPNAACSSNRGCYSATLRREVTNGECVQVTAAGCGSGSCAWYTCDEGAWQCTDASSCGGMRHPNAACSAPMSARRSCRSTLLGRNVVDGTCVQVTSRERPGEPESCAGGCGWYECDDGTWTCTDSSACRGDQIASAACAPAGDDCRSDTLGRPVNHGDCVQVTRPSCGVERCGWYACGDGSWSCTDPTSCRGVTHEHMACDDVDPCDAKEDCEACNDTTGCGWCGATGECQSDRKRVECGESWLDRPSSCVDCSGHTDCESCARSGFCGWCPGVGCLNDSTEPARMCPDYMAASCG